MAVFRRTGAYAVQLRAVGLLHYFNLAIILSGDYGYHQAGPGCFPRKALDALQITTGQALFSNDLFHDIFGAQREWE